MATQPSEHSKIPPYPSHPHRRPAVPDLRFEHSYIRSIAPYVHVEHRPPASASPAPKTHDLKGKAKAVEFVDDAEHEVTLEPREDIRIQWTQVLWITCRDQVLSPFLQGAIWGVASHYLHPALAAISVWWQRGSGLKKARTSADGGGVQWLKEWAGSLKTESAGTGARANLALHK